MKKTIYYLKKALLALSFIAFTTTIWAQNEFITVWKTDNPGALNDTTIILPASGEYTYSLDRIVNGNPSGTPMTGTSTDVDTFHVVVADTYLLELTPTGATPFHQISFANSGDVDKLIEIKQWGATVWSSLDSAYFGADSLTITATDTIDLTNVTDMSYAFASSSIDSIPSISGWDVSGVTNLEGTFMNLVNFNDSIGSWDVSSVLNMKNTFAGATSFNQDISSWNVAAVVEMDSLFMNASSFNQAIGNWDVSGVTGMINILTNATSFNQSLQNWDIQSVVDSISLSNTNISCANYSLTLHEWAFDATTPNSITLNATGLTYGTEFQFGKDALINDLSWTINDDGTGSCTNILPDPFVTVWNSNNPGVSATNEIEVPATGDYDYKWEQLDATLNPTGVTGLGRASGTTTIVFPAAGNYQVKIIPYGTAPFNEFTIGNQGDKEKLIRIDSWGETVWKSLDSSFYGATNLAIVATDVPDLDSVKSMQYTFAATQLDSIPNVHNWDVSNVENMKGLFMDAPNFNDSISGWDVSSVTDMSFMFRNDTSFTTSIVNWDVSSVNNIEQMLAGATSFNQDISSWDVSSVTDMDSLFAGATLFNQAIGDWNVSNVTSMKNMLSKASSFNQTIGTWNIGNVVGTISIDSTAMSCENYSYTLYGWASGSIVPTSITLEAAGLTYSADIVGEYNHLVNDQSWTITDGGQGACSGIIPTAFITVWKTDNVGVSNAQQVTIPANGKFTYSWVEVGVATNTGNGIGENSTTISFPNAGTYEISITPLVTNPFNQIRFNDEGDKNKILEIKQWGEIEWISLANSYRGATNLQITATDAPNLDSVKSMKYAFAFTSLATISNIANWDVSNVENMKALFYNTPFNQDISGWDMTGAVTISYMFANADEYNQPVGTWDVTNIEDMSGIFDNATSFNQSLEAWELRKLNGDISLVNTAMSCQNYSRTLREWFADTNTVENLTLKVEGLEYGAEAAYYRHLLIDSLDWIIYGDTQGNCTMGLNKNSLSNTYSAYPNPAYEMITVSGLTGNEVLRIVDVTGRMIRTIQINQFSDNYSLSLSQLSKGIYTLLITTKYGATKSLKFIKR